MVFRYEPQKDYYIFYEDIDEWHLKEVRIPVGTFILDFLSLDMHNLMKTLLNMQDDVLNYKFKIFHSGSFPQNTVDNNQKLIDDVLVELPSYFCFSHRH